MPRKLHGLQAKGFDDSVKDHYSIKFQNGSRHMFCNFFAGIHLFIYLFICLFIRLFGY